MDETLKLILSKLDTIERDTREGFDGLNKRLDKVERRLDNLETDGTEIRKDVKVIKKIVKRIEDGQPEDITAILSIINMKLDKLISEKRIRIRRNFD